MTTEELLVKRYKVIGPYPFSPYKVGDIISPKNGDVNFIAAKTETYYHFLPISKICEMENLFEPLPWWKERRVEEMPEYLKCLSPNYKWIKGDIVKVDKWIESFGSTLRFYSPDTDKITHHPFSFIPATEADYNAYLQTTKTN